MMHLALKGFFLLFFFPSFVIANQNMPLTYLGKPLDSLCIYDAEEGKPIKLSECGITSSRDREKINRKNSYMVGKGYIGYDYIYKSDNFKSEAASYYKYIGKLKDYDVVITLNNTGGSGNFMSLVLLKLDNDKIVAKSIAMGDRCNGGVDDAKIVNGELLFSVNITPGDLLDLSNAKNPGLKPYDSLASCAICCVGLANFKYNLDENRSHLVSVTIKKDTLKELQQGSEQSCFNQTLQSYIGSEKTLPIDKLNAFMEQVYSKCKG